MKTTNSTDGTRSSDHGADALRRLADAGQDLVRKHTDRANRVEEVLQREGLPLSTAITGRYLLSHENPHSAILGFLLDPSETHGIG